MSNVLVVLFGGLLVLVVRSLVRQQHVKGALDRERRIAELNRIAAKEGRLRSGSEAR